MLVRVTHLQVMIKVVAIFTIPVMALIALCNFWVAKTTSSALYSDIDNLPYNQVGVLLGTSKFSRLGGYNDHYQLRVSAAYRLYKAGKIDYILISGDNSSRFYDEPSTIRRDLLQKGSLPTKYIATMPDFAPLIPF